MDPLRRRLKIYLLIFLGVIVFGTVGFMVLEDLSFPDALYFNIVTFATVGYGDIHPTTLYGKIFSAVIIILGVGTFLGVIANATEMMLSRREKQVRFEKLNMVIGVFFSELGTKLLKTFASYDAGISRIHAHLVITGAWTEKDFLYVSSALKTYDYDIDISRIDFDHLKDMLLQQRDMLVRLLENPVLLEHESFTNLLRAVFHLTEELSFRGDLKKLPDTDREHLAGDVKRAYPLLLGRWVEYMYYLKGNYPYLFSLAMRTNPFDSSSSAVITK